MNQVIVVRATGGPEVLEFVQAPIAEAGPSQVRVRQTAIGVNFSDTLRRAGVLPAPMPFVPGTEGVGVVVAVGAEVTDIVPGDRVAYRSASGTYARECLVQADHAIAVPDDIDDLQVAAILSKGLSAWCLLFKARPIAAGDTLLYHGATGGVGHITCRWARSLGARVIGTVGSAGKMAVARANGCDEVIDYSEEDFVARVLELTAGQGVDVVYDGVGRKTFLPSLDCLRPLGSMVSFGFSSGPTPPVDASLLMAKGSLFLTGLSSSHYLMTREALLAGADALFDAFRSGRITAAIDRSYPLKDAAAAHRAIAAREVMGSVVLIP